VGELSPRRPPPSLQPPHRWRGCPPLDSPRPTADAPSAARPRPAVRGDIQCTTNLYALGLLRTIRHLRNIERFFDEAAAGTLPAVSVVDPDFQTCSEENPQDIHAGEGFAAAVINAVMRGRGWAHTLLIWLYDEHGGYYDHVPPPLAVEPDDVLPHSLAERPASLQWLWRHSTPGSRTRPPAAPRTVAALSEVPPLDANTEAPHGRYDRYGFRVPAVIVSPFAKPGFVSSMVYDHTSALKPIEE
jgi:phospholipase C